MKIKKEHLDSLISKIKEREPKFKIKFKNESLLMKIIGLLMFFNKRFMSTYITTIGSTVYFPTKQFYESNITSSFRTLAHEYVHIMDNKKDFLFKVKYLVPQLCFVFAFFGFWHWPFFLFALALAPIPAYWRAKAEVRGYGMNVFLNEIMYTNKQSKEEAIKAYTNSFVDSGYYYMWPFPDQVEVFLRRYKDVDYLKDPKNGEKFIPYQDLYEIVIYK